MNVHHIKAKKKENEQYYYHTIICGGIIPLMIWEWYNQTCGSYMKMGNKPGRK